MNKKSFKHVGLKLVLLAALVLPQIAGAQYFYSSQQGDVDLGFRKTGSHQEPYEMVVYLGNCTNYLALTAGSTLSITNYNHQQLTNMCYDNLGNLQWSVFSSFQYPVTNSIGVYPAETCIYTLPRTNAFIPAATVKRLSYSSDSSLQGKIQSAASGATSISQQLSTTNVYNNTLVVLESTTSSDQVIQGNLLTVFIGDRSNPALGDFSGQQISYSVENTTSNSFTSPSISDFYVNVPSSSALTGTNIDPYTGLANGNADRVGSFTLSTSGTLSYTAAYTFSASTTSGTAPFKVVFSNTATNPTGVTNWVWNFGNGTSITNTTGANVTNTYASAGTYTVTLTLNGPNGSSEVYLANYIVVTGGSTPTPVFTSELLSGGKLIVNGTNGTSSAQFRILQSTNLITGNWQPVYTNTFLGNGNFSYTNSSPTNAASFYRLVTP